MNEKTTQFNEFENGTPPDNNLVLAILCTVLCCLPFGVVSIIKSASVNTLWAHGQYDASRKAAEDAKKYAIWGAVVPIVGVVLYILFFIILIVANVVFGRNEY